MKKEKRMTVKFPAVVYNYIKASAIKNRRSFQKEIICIIENTMPLKIAQEDDRFIKDN